jgi:hypothetical protein
MLDANEKVEDPQNSLETLQHLGKPMDKLRDANEKVEYLQNSLETLQHLGKLMLAARCQ